MYQFDKQSLKTHITILGWLNIAGGLLSLVVGAFVFMLLAGIGIASSDPDALPILAFIGTMTGMLMFVLALPSLLAGYGLLRGKNWGRILAIIVAFFDLLSFPIGTIFGIYGLWVLLRKETTDYFLVPKTV